MVRWLGLCVAVVALSAVAAWLSLSMPNSGSASNGLLLPGAGEAEATKPSGRAVVEGELIHEFGVMAQQTKGQRDWVIKNEGPGDLTLQGGHPACSCTVLNLGSGAKHVLKVGENYPLKIEWETRQNYGAYEKSASIYTSDPKKPELTFVVKGTVQPAILVVPEGGILDARGAVNTQRTTLNAMLASFDRPDLKITGITTSNPALLEVEQHPLTEEEAKSVRVPKGIRLDVVIKPSQKLGSFSEEVVVQTDHPLKPEVRLGVAGNIVGPISATPSRVRLGDVKAGKGDTTALTLWVQGQETTTFTVAEAPEKLKVAVVPVDDKTPAANGARAYRLTVTVPPEVTPQIIDAPIVLKTDHPQAGEVRIPVSILVTGAE
jgi:hypothetical protein